MSGLSPYSRLPTYSRLFAVMDGRAVSIKPMSNTPHTSSHSSGVTSIRGTDGAHPSTLQDYGRLYKVA